MKKLIDKILRNRLLQHLSFWLVSFYILLTSFASSVSIQEVDVVYTLIFHVTLIIPVYINIELFIPRILARNNYVTYLLVSLTLLVFSVLFNYFMFSVLVDWILPGYYFISYYNFIDLSKFYIVYLGVTTLLKMSKGWFRLAETEKEKLEYELKALKSQINPHFIFNSLTGIYGLARSKSGKAPETILKMAEMMRYMLYEADNDYVSLDKELGFIRHYFDLQELRTGDDCDIQLNINSDSKERMIAPLLFVPLIENSFKHGIMGSHDKRFVHLNIDVNENNLSFHLINNKGKAAHEITDNWKGIGLENVKKRLKLLYPDKHRFELTENDTTFSVTMELTLLTELKA
ncbi:hypothetical protein EYV94_17255 [Puteibacter caeruleilacunae]|nr:hypothetical protein EYV94_17255 [Puteibacter caeruleilacunae]